MNTKFTRGARKNMTGSAPGLEDMGTTGVKYRSGASTMPSRRPSVSPTSVKRVTTARFRADGNAANLIPPSGLA
jgi:hypothetical protein